MLAVTRSPTWLTAASTSAALPPWKKWYVEPSGTPSISASSRRLIASTPRRLIIRAAPATIRSRVSFGMPRIVLHLYDDCLTLPDMTSYDSCYSQTIAADDGRALRATWFGPEVPRGAVLLAPAMATPATFYRPLARWLAQAGLLTLTFDYRGTGGVA